MRFSSHPLFLISSSVACFRAANPKLEKLLNRDYVERVEIFMKETIGVEGTNFVDILIWSEVSKHGV